MIFFFISGFNSKSIFQLNLFIQHHEAQCRYILQVHVRCLIVFVLEKNLLIFCATLNLYFVMNFRHVLFAWNIMNMDYPDNIL